MKKFLKFSLSVIVLLSFFGNTTKALDNGENDGYEVGDKARDFSLKNVDGAMVSLSDYKEAKGFIVVFTCNECPYSKMYEDRIISLHEEFAGKGYPVVAINPNDPAVVPGDSYEHMQKRAKEKSFPFAYVYDETQEIAKAYGATRTPHVYLLNKKGETLEVAYIGAIDDNPRNALTANEHYVKDAIADLEAGETVKVPTSKAIGCTIKWSKS